MNRLVCISILVLSLTALKVETPSSLQAGKIAVIDFMEHYWFHAFGLHMEVEDCQNGVSEALEVVDETIALIKLGHMVQAITYLMHKISVVKEDFLSCTAIAPIF